MPPAAYRAANPEKVRAYNKAWKLANPEKDKAYRIAWRKRNPGRNAAYATEWRKQRPEETAMEMQQRVFNAKKHNNGRSALQVTDLAWPTHCPALGIELDYTGKDLTSSWSIDKFDPTLGYTPGNVGIISRRANQIKSDATAAEVRQVANWMDQQTKSL